MVVSKVKEGKDDFGFNAKTDTYENMYEAGVIDPTKVTRVALENAASVAGLLLTTEATITEIPKEERNASPGMGGNNDVISALEKSHLTWWLFFIFKGDQ